MKLSIPTTMSTLLYSYLSLEGEIIIADATTSLRGNNDDRELQQALLPDISSFRLYNSITNEFMTKINEDDIIVPASYGDTDALSLNVVAVSNFNTVPVTFTMNDRETTYFHTEYVHPFALWYAE